MAEAILVVLALLGISLAAAGALANRIGMPPALGYVLIGLLASPFAFGRGIIDPELVRQSSEVGILFLLFLIGLELDLGRLRDAIKKTALTMPFDIIAPVAAVSAVVILFGWPLTQALALGIVFAVSSTLFGERLTAAPGVESSARQRVIGVLISQDVAAAALLALLVVLAGGAAAEGWSEPILAILQLMFLLLILSTAALITVPRILDSIARTHVHELVVLGAIGLVVSFGYLGQLAGSAELGALVAGVAAAEAGSRFVVRNTVKSIRDIALALFFLASGMAVDIQQVVAQWQLVLAVAGSFLVAKVAVHSTASLASGLSLRPSLQAAFALGAMGEFSLILLSVAEARGLAHPVARTTVVGSIFVLLLVAPLLLRNADRISKVVYRLPRHIKSPLDWTVTTMRKTRLTGGSERRRVATQARILASNLLLLLAWGLFMAWAIQTLTDRVTYWHPLFIPALLVGLTIAVAMPLVVSGYRSYRSLVWELVGLRPGEREGAGKVRSRIVDTWVALTVVLALLPLGLNSSYQWQTVLGGALVAVIVATVAWRQLDRFHGTLEGTLTRVLGHDPQAGVLLDQVMQEYPWGVRFATVAVPPNSPLVGQSIESCRLGELTGAIVAVLQRGRQEFVNPNPKRTILAGDFLVLMGDAHQLSRAEALIVSHGEALRLTVQSRQASVEEVTVSKGSAWMGQQLGPLNVKEQTGTLVVGVWPHNAQHPRPFRPDLELNAGDRLILMGTPLQISRARAIAEGVVDPDLVDGGKDRADERAGPV